jgi:acyl-CoA reductase-like NAD-dependent aldehyde dehydrogenase
VTRGRHARCRRCEFDGPGGGCYVAPTLVTDVRNDMRIEEIFEPVLSAIPFKHAAEALAMAERYAVWPHGLNALDRAP